MKSLNSKRIGIVSWDFRDAKGGLGRAFQDIAQTVGVVSVFAPSEGHLVFTKKWGKQFLFSFLFQWKIASWVRKNALDTVIIPVGPGGIFLLRILKNVRVCSVVYHTYDQQMRLVPGQWWKRIFVPFEKRTFAFSDAILTYSPVSRDLLKTYYKQPAERIHLLPQLLDLHGWKSDSAITKEEYLCICVSRLEERKGILVLLQAWVKVSKSLPRARLLIVGDGVLRSKVDRQIQKLGDSVRRISRLTYKDLQKQVKRSSVAVYPSYLEGFGLAVAEAMLAGTPVIVSKVDGHTSLIENNRTGVFFQSGNSEELAETIIDVLRDPERQMHLAEAAQEDIEKRFERHAAKEALKTVISAG